MPLLLRMPIQFSPTNSRSATRQLIQSLPKSLMNRSIISMHSAVHAYELEFEQERDGYVLIGHVKQQNVDVILTVLPIGAFHCQYQHAIDRTQRENQERYQVHHVTRKNPLQPTYVGLLLSSVGQPDQFHDLSLGQCLQQQGHQFDAPSLSIFPNFLA